MKHTDMDKIEVPFGAKDSELKGWEYTIPEGMEAFISDGKVVVRKKESEDERMRKALIETIDSIENFPNKGAAIAYLEKQKEQKPVEHYWKQMEWADIDIDEFTENVRHLIIDKLTTSIPSVGGGKLTSTVFIDDKTAKEIANGILFFIGPQKPAEWSKEDEKMQYFVNQFLEYHEASDPTAKSCKKWFNNRLKSLRPQPKNEWSEEDEKMIDHIIYCLPKMAMGNIEMLPSVAEQYANRLKSLRPQHRQGRSDYITPHKEFFKWIYDRLINVHKENPDVDYMISFKKRIEELPLDEPSWKPSEEQMEALNYAIAEWDGGKKLEGLYALRTDLKKL